jgi:hypothetical protein
MTIDVQTVAVNKRNTLVQVSVPKIRLTALEGHTASADGNTLTRTGNAAISIDGATPLVNDVFAYIPNDVPSAESGLYKVVTVGSGAAPWVITRVSDWLSGTALGVTSLAITVLDGTKAGRVYMAAASGASLTIGTSLLYADLFADASGSTSMIGVYGDGSDGAVVLDGTAAGAWGSLGATTYTLTRDLMATTLVLATGYTLKPAGFRVLATESMTIVGTVSAAGLPAATSTPGAAVADKSVAGSVIGGTPAPGFGVGVAGGNVASALGGAGGASGAGTAGAGAAGGTVTAVGATYGTIRSLPQAVLGAFIGLGGVSPARGGGSGAAGSGDGAGVLGGAGGAGGGVLVLASKAITVSLGGVVSAAGGAGGAAPGAGAGGTGGGGGGGGGFIALVSNTLTETGSVTAAGGAPGALAGTGAAGIIGSAGTILRLSNA